MFPTELVEETDKDFVCNAGLTTNKQREQKRSTYYAVCSFSNLF
jgi:hypothetical protein